MKATLTHTDERGTAELMVNSPTMMRLFYHPGAKDGSTSFVWNGVEYTGSVTVRYIDGAWTCDTSYQVRDVSFSRTDNKYNSYNANQMSFANTEKVARHFEEVAHAIRVQRGSLFEEAAVKNKADKIKNLKLDIASKQEKIAKLQEEVAALFTALDSATYD